MDVVLYQFFVKRQYCEEPDAGKPHVRICEGLRARVLSLLDCCTYRIITQKRLQLELPTENSVYSQENRNRAGNYAHLTSENGK